jgi:nitrite reductase/ring-hydroxylating ferredoxin subunit/uncharacterized membrane protein
MIDYSRSLRRGVRRIERTEALDRVYDTLAPYVQRMTANPEIKRILSGAPMGHRLHPMLTDIPIGCWTSASVLDLVAWRSGAPAARRLTALGIAGTIPTIASGLSDWVDTDGGARRIGVVHAASNTIALALEIASWSARRRRHHLRGALLGFCGIGVATVGGYLGGHLVFARRVGPDVDVPVVADEMWREACSAQDLVDDHPVGVTVDGTRIVLVRRSGRVFALAAVCNHAGGPLDRGTVVGDAIRCPWHGSEFCLGDGTVARGPAAAAQPVYETRVRDGVVEVRRGDAGEDERESSPSVIAERARGARVVDLIAGPAEDAP